MIFFSTDFHLSHKNIVKGISKWTSDTRDFQTVEEHDDAIINSLNEVVSRNDTLYFLGDFCLGKFSRYEECRDRIKCDTIHLIYGNHDKQIRKSKYLQSLFSSCNDILKIKINEQDIILCHYAMLVWEKSHYGSWMLHGHSHGNLTYPYKAKILDVCLENHDYKPWSLEEVKSYMDRIETHKVDHH